MKLEVLEQTYIDKLMVVGHTYANIEKTSRLMQSVGIDYANVSKKEKMEAEEISQTILKSKNRKKSKERTTQLKVSKVWDALVLDLFLGNVDKDFWLWEDSKAVHLLDYWKSLDEQLAFLLVYTDPKTTLNNFLASKENLTPKDLDALLQEWFNYNTTLLNFFYKNQDRALLVNTNQLDKNHSKYINQLSKQIGLNVNEKKIHNVLMDIDTFSSVSESNDGLVEYLGETLFYEYPEMIALYEELQSVANIYNTENMYPKTDVKDAFCALVALKNEQSDLKEENTALVNTLHKKEQAFYRDKKRLKNKHRKAKRNFKSSESALEEKVEELSKASKKREVKFQKRLSKKDFLLQKQEEENELLLQQLHHVQEELEKYYLENTEMKTASAKLIEVKNALEAQKKALESKLASTAKSAEDEKLQLQKEFDRKLQLSSEKATQEKTKHESEQKEENELLLQQLHHVQEELEKYYLENQRLKEQREEKKRFYGAAERVKDELSYRLGAKMIEKSKSFFGILGLPFSLMGVRSQYKKDLKLKKVEELPPIESYADAYDAERVRAHLSYKLGETTLKTMKNPLGFMVLPFRLVGTRNRWKKDRDS